MDLTIEVKQLHKLNGDGKLRAFADVTVSGLLLIKGLRIVDGKNGLFVGMPCTPGKDGQWYQTVFPLSDDVQEQLNEAVLEAYQR